MKKMEAMKPEFNASITELNNLLAKADFETHDVNSILDKLNALECDVIPSEMQLLGNAVRNCCLSIPTNNSLLVAKSSNFIFNVLSKHKVEFYDKDYDLIVQWISSSLDSCADIAYMDLLQLINVLVKSNNFSLDKQAVNLFNILFKKLEYNANISNPSDIKIIRINCLKNLIETLPQDFHVRLAKEFLDILYNQTTNDLIHHSQVWTVVLTALDLLCAKNSTWLDTLLSEVIGVVLYGVEIGLNGKLPTNPKSIFPSAVTLPPTQSNVELTKVKLKVKRKQKNKVKQVSWSEKQIINVEIENDGLNNEYFNTSWVTSDSDFSDNEGNQLSKLSKAQAKARHSAFNLLIQIIKVLGCKVLYQYYNVLLAKLIVCIKNEKLSKPKVAAMAATNALLLGAKLFLAQAQHSDGGAFTTFSEVLSELVTGLHSTLIGVLNTVPHLSVAIPLLHTTSALISVTPYHRLRPALLSNLFKAIYLYINHKDPTVIVGVLHCLSEIVILNPITNEQKDIIISGFSDGSYKGDSWLLSHCFTSLKEQTCSDVRVACWQVLGGLCQCHFETALPQLTTLESYIFQDLNAPNKPMIYAAKTLEHVLSQLLLKDEYDTHRKELWMQLLEGPFVSLIENSRRAAAIACDCLSNIGPQVFNSLKEETQIFIITLVYGCCYSEVIVVRASAINTLGVLLLFPQLTHEQFVHDTKDILMKSLGDESDYVRTKAAWAFGNLVDLLIENQDKEFVLEISILKLLEASLLVANDNNRVKANILRAVGNLLLMMTEEQLSMLESKDTVEKAVNFCLTSSNTGTLMKMRWNACYAIGTFLKNDALYKFSNNWLGAVFNTLSNLLVKCSNFKVRANACAAICSVKKREYFGIYYTHVWSSLLDGFDNASNMPDYKEFKHQDNLIYQLCCATSHLANLLQLGDILELNEIMTFRIDTFKQKILHFQNSAPPEKSGTLLNAFNNINQLLKMDLEMNQRKFLLCFQNVFMIV